MYTAIKKAVYALREVNEQQQSIKKKIKDAGGIIVDFSNSAFASWNDASNFINFISGVYGIKDKNAIMVGELYNAIYAKNDQEAQMHLNKAKREAENYTLNVDNELSKEAFLKMIRRSLHVDEYDCILSDLLCPDSYGIIQVPCGNSAMITFLEEITDDEAEWIQYFLWELEGGKKWHKGMITDTDGNDIPLATANDLWKLLLENRKEL